VVEVVELLLLEECPELLLEAGGCLQEDRRAVKAELAETLSLGVEASIANLSLSSNQDSEWAVAGILTN
jgi:hypothetical protein